MPTTRRRLTLESFEERSLPSANFSPKALLADSARSAKTDDAAKPIRGEAVPVYTVWTGHLVTGDGSVVRVRIIFESRFFIRFDSGRDRVDDGFADRSGSPPRAGAKEPVADFRSGSQVSSSSSLPAATARPTTVAPAAPLTAVVPPPDGGPSAPVGETAAGVIGAAPVTTSSANTGVPVAAQILNGQFISVAAAGRFLVGEAAEVSDAAPPVIPPADPGEPSTPPTVSPEVPDLLPVIESVAPALLPVAGALPVDLESLNAAASSFLDRVADLDLAWPEDESNVADYAWTAVAVLLTGAAIYSASGSRGNRPARRPIEPGSALAEWEGKNVGRSD